MAQMLQKVITLIKAALRMCTLPRQRRTNHRTSPFHDPSVVRDAGQRRLEFWSCPLLGESCSRPDPGLTPTEVCSAEEQIHLSPRMTEGEEFVCLGSHNQVPGTFSSHSSGGWKSRSRFDMALVLASETRISRDTQKTTGIQDLHSFPNIYKIFLKLRSDFLSA
ncbi:uncharacterized protein LOC144313848 [Canis aureus]